MDLLNEILENHFLQNAILGAALIGFANGFFSGFVNLRKDALAVSALAHTMLPGIAVAVLITGSLSQTSAFIGALIACLVVGLGSVVVSRNSRIPHDTALSVIYTTTFAGGLALLPHLPVANSLHDWLFGNIIHISQEDLKMVFIISSITLVLCTLFMRPILLTLFEPNVAAAQGVPTRTIQYLTFTLLILMLVASLQAVGTILSAALLVAPATIMLLFTNRTSLIFWGGAFIGCISGVGGILLALALDIQAGPAIILLLGILFLLAFLFSPRYGILFRKTAHSR
ncbi:manganese/iron transport system permease protein [Rubritalea squalenifaciens DSM 18772]|uniref:Manganese/iron transport system permease protein n=1 Tax=Rubritalea squalenifaciens DSM 18772 TaxID=1123071 RepID=A0A1M6KQ50_9BACT|nr:metal ABC transporter permease [Rubritalea squalenifaciens]SHJ61069.1 manganese/iron transport system permease protein [Rubritalea squalenifaciens DSM 18772]